MKENSTLLYDVIHNQSAWFFIAGNAKQMPDQVTDALKEALKTHGSLDSDQVDKYVTKMEANKRFQTETWS